METVWGIHQLVTLVLGCLAAGVIGGIPIGIWIFHQPVSDERRCKAETPTCVLAQHPEPASPPRPARHRTP